MANKMVSLEQLERFYQNIKKVFAFKSDVVQLSQDKQDKLIAGDNVTIDGNVISASGDVDKAYVDEQVLNLQKVNANQDRKITALWELGENITHRFETSTDEAYTKQIPTGAKMFDLKMLGGKCIVENQIIKNGNFENGLNDWIPRYSSEVSVIDNVLKVTMDSSYENYNLHGQIRQTIMVKAGHTYLFRCKFKTDGVSKKPHIRLNAETNWTNTNSLIIISPYNSAILPATNQWQVYTIKVMADKDYPCFFLGADNVSNEEQTYSFYYTDIEIHDITNGLSDITVEEFDAIFPQYRPYTEPTIKSICCDCVEVKGKNLCEIKGFSASSVNATQSNLTNANSYGTTITSQGNKVIVNQSQAPNTSSASHYTNGYFTVALDTSKLVVGKNYYFSCDFTPTKIPLTIQYLPILPNGANGKSTSLLNLELNKKNKIKVNDVVWETSNSGVNSYMEIRIGGASGIWENFMITDTEDDNYAPYKPLQQLTIPTETLTELQEKGYGQGVNSDVYNYLYVNDEGRKIIRKRIEKVDMSSLQWALASGVSSPSGYIFRTNISNIKVREVNTTNNVLCIGYSTDSTHRYTSNMGNMEIMVATGSATLYLRNDTYDNDLSAFVNSLVGQVLYYELAEPIEYDVTDLLPDFAEDVLCEANGSITFKNTLGEDYRIPLPNSEEFAVKLSEV